MRIPTQNPIGGGDHLAPLITKQAQQEDRGHPLFSCDLAKDGKRMVVLGHSLSTDKVTPYSANSLVLSYAFPGFFGGLRPMFLGFPIEIL